jgi:hypothetical protein
MVKLTPKKGWAMIAEIDWAKNYDVDVDVTKKRIMKTWTREECQALSDFADEMYMRLEKVARRFEKKRGRWICEPSDDGRHDQLSEIVGRGQKRFEACLANPALIERTPSHENFFYVLPWEDDYKKKGGA